MRATVRVFGNVQAVGYRALVKFIARSLGVRGLVRNLDDGSVEVFAEAPEDIMDRFVKMIDVKGRAEDVLSLHVERVEVSREGETGYSGPWRSYGAFEIDYGEERPRPIERDMAESLEWSGLYFTKLVTEFSDLRREFRDYRDEFRDYRNEFREFKNESISLANETLEEVKELRRDLKTILDERLARLERDISEIKAKLGLL
ncbi:acylphosphatase [Candidatus Caldarchaeum subterraneum]|uniref:acylphosphatase n=1 Tax=Caldiarchaeum subterraneum TaxID=311458 RepID=E6N4A4_CALS0|nr:acylphosphatase [Candidatus Caldarchaeum subterraneum]BAJ49950.1 acylphosphatase [Candidatus Caldarchaeum subterraneum]